MKKPIPETLKFRKNGGAELEFRDKRNSILIQVNIGKKHKKVIEDSK